MEGRCRKVEAVEILKDIIRALAALNGDVVHRDLKPENVLFYQDAWCLADFGIARYAELTTATETWKYAKTKEYAAPEQWRGERATGATDVYATGVMAYELLAGERPFGGPQEHDYRDQHLHEEAPGLTGCRAALASLVAECLYKSPKARPTAENIQGRLEGIGLKVSASGQRLQQADQRAAQQRSGDEALASAAQSVAEERDSLARTAEQSLERMLGALRDRVRDLAPGSHLRGSGQTSWTIELVDTQMGAGGFSSAAASLLDSPGYPAPFDVVAYSSIHVHIPTDHWGYEGRSHSLWFCDAESEGLFRWYETAFMFGPFFGKQGKKDPFALDPDTVVGRALSPVSGTEFQVAWPFTSVDQGREEEFYERWIAWFADATEGKLRHPSSMPENDTRGSWRR